MIELGIIFVKVFGVFVKKISKVNHLKLKGEPLKPEK